MHSEQMVSGADGEQAKGEGARLGDVLGGLLDSASWAQVQADRTSVEIAKIYLATPLLQRFVVPRLQIREIDFELQVAFCKTPGLTSYGRLRLLESFGQEALGLLDRPPLLAVLMKIPKLGLAWNAALRGLIANLSRQIEREPGAEAERLAYGALLAVQQSFLGAVLGDKELTFRLRKRLSVLLLQIKKHVGARLLASAQAILQEPAAVDSSVRVLITHSDLQKVSPSRISKLRLTLQPSNRRWVREGDAHRLLPD